METAETDKTDKTAMKIRDSTETWKGGRRQPGMMEIRDVKALMQRLHLPPRHLLALCTIVVQTTDDLIMAPGHNIGPPPDIDRIFLLQDGRHCCTMVCVLVRPKYLVCRCTTRRDGVFVSMNASRDHAL